MNWDWGQAEQSQAAAPTHECRDETGHARLCHGTQQHTQNLRLGANLVGVGVLFLLVSVRAGTHGSSGCDRTWAGLHMSWVWGRWASQTIALLVHAGARISADWLGFVAVSISSFQDRV